MLDTCIFNWLIDGDILPEQLPSGAEYFITHIQLDELAAVSSAERRNKLFAQLHALTPSNTPTESMIVGISRVGDCKISDGHDYTEILAALDQKKKKNNNAKDAVIGETALKNQYTLLSADRALCDVMESMGASVFRFSRRPY